MDTNIIFDSNILIAIGFFILCMILLGFVMGVGCSYKVQDDEKRIVWDKSIWSGSDCRGKSWRK